MTKLGIDKEPLNKDCQKEQDDCYGLMSAFFQFSQAAVHFEILLLNWLGRYAIA